MGWGGEEGCNLRQLPRVRAAGLRVLGPRAGWSVRGKRAGARAVFKVEMDIWLEVSRWSLFFLAGYRSSRFLARVPLPKPGRLTGGWHLARCILAIQNNALL